jgi:hypothetical protein
MSARDCGYLQGSELSVSIAGRVAGAGGEDDAPPSPGSPTAGPAPLARRATVGLTPAEAGWAPVASSMSGRILPLDDVLVRLADGLTDGIAG